MGCWNHRKKCEWEVSFFFLWWHRNTFGPSLETLDRLPKCQLQWVFQTRESVIKNCKWPQNYTILNRPLFLCINELAVKDWRVLVKLAAYWHYWLLKLGIPNAVIQYEVFSRVCLSVTYSRAKLGNNWHLTFLTK